MKKLFIICFSLIAFTATYSQVLISLQLPPSGVTVKSQLWNFSLINTSNGQMNVQVEVILTDVTNNQRVLTGTSKVFQLAKGIRQIQAGDVTPVIYNVNNSNYGMDASPNGFLPVGQFNICYTIIQLISDASDRLAEECETIEIEPISPPILVLPSDSEHVDITRPVFTWIPPAPFNLFSNLLYDWLLVEVQPMQTGATAIQQNIPLLSQSGIGMTNFQYPLSSAELDTSKLYAWQVTAKNNSVQIAKSEVWTFKVMKYNPDTSVYKKIGFYVKLKREYESSYSICQGDLKFEYLNELNDQTAFIRIYDISKAKPEEIFPDIAHPVLKFGKNLMSIAIDGINGIADKHIYLLELNNSKREKWFMKFEYRQLNQ